MPLFFCAAAAAADTTPAATAFLVNETDATAVTTGVTTALASPDPLTRATAARVALVRNATLVLPQLRDMVRTETDLNAQREVLRAVVMLGDASDIDLALRAVEHARWPAMEVVARAIARRDDAIEQLFERLRPAGFAADADFFNSALWQRQTMAIVAGSRLIGLRDGESWRALLQTMLDSNLALPGTIVGASLNSAGEDIRTASVWYLVDALAFDPSRIDGYVRSQLEAPTETASVREEFGRELLRRMLGGEPRRDERWTQWLATSEADDLIGTKTSLFRYFTDEEFATRKLHCDVATYDCRVFDLGRVSAPMAVVVPPAFLFPTALPPRLAPAVVSAARCGPSWLGVAAASSDRSGRMQQISIRRVAMTGACEKALTTLARLSLVTPGAINAALTTANVVLVGDRGTNLCLDEDLPLMPQRTRNTSSAIVVPRVKRRVEPVFPPGALQRMHGSAGVTVEATISRTGCVRSLQLVAQSPFGDLNSSALIALSKWTFEPGRLNGQPVDTLFRLTVTFRH